MTDDKDPGWVRRRIAADVWKAIAAELWNPSSPTTYLLPEEMGEDPERPLRRRSKEECPPKGFPYRPLTEDEVRAFAQGLGRMTTNARRANEDAHVNANSDAEMVYRVQADANEKALKLLEMVLSGEYPPPDVN